MVDKANSEPERLARILDRIAEEIEGAPGNELLADACQDGRDPAQTAARVKGLLRQAMKKHAQALLQKSKEGYEREAAAMRSRHIKLPQSPQRLHSISR
jgi:hypothetical protein